MKTALPGGPTNDALIQVALESLEREVSSRTAPELIEWNGLSLILLPKVHPAVSPLLEPLLKDPNKFELLHGQSVADMGCGSGIISIVMARAGMHVMAVDIDPIAIRNTKINSLLNDVSIEVHHSDFFTELPSAILFDHIIFNPPFFLSDTPGQRRMWFISPRELSSFFNQSHGRLKKDGRVLFTASSLENVARIVAIVEEEGFVIDKQWEFNFDYTDPDFSETVYYFQFRF